MNLNEIIVNKPKGRGRRIVRNIRNAEKISQRKTAEDKKFTNNLNFKINKTANNTSTLSSDLNWGKSHISVPNTPSSSAKKSTSKTSDEPENKIILALTEGRGDARCEVGIAAICVSRPLLILCQISDTQSYINTLTKINVFEPDEILVPNTFTDKFSGNRLLESVKKQFPNIKYNTVLRSSFNKVAGLETLTDLCIPSLNGVLLVLQHRYYALAAASALMTYIQENFFVYYSPESLKIEYQQSEGYAVIDISTADRLELVCSACPTQNKKFSNLFSIMNHCQTKIGKRTLRSAILQPLYEVEYIEKRLNCVTELIEHPELLSPLQALLLKISDVDLLLSIGTVITDDPQKCTNRQLNYILVLNNLLELLTPLSELLSNFEQPFFVQLKKTIENKNFDRMKQIVRETINENARPVKGTTASMQRCFAIKPYVNGLLDLVRKTYSERLDDMREYVKMLANKHQLPLTLGNNQTKGYHIIYHLSNKRKKETRKSDLPEEFIQVQQLAGSFTMKTPELVNLSTRLDDILLDALKISNVIVHAIIVDVKEYADLFYTLSEEIAYLDVLQSLAQTSITSCYVRPTFGDFTEIAKGRHPLLDFLLPKLPIANSMSCSNDYNIHIITGPNGSGKSIFIRQVLLLQVMAQVGCYVPAESAIFRPADHMFARVYLEDNMECGASSFVLEMTEMKYIMTTMTENSLIIIDELGRSTCTDEGTAIAMSIIEQMAQSSVYLYATTHYLTLTALSDMYPNIKLWQLETIVNKENPKSFKMDFKYSVTHGITAIRRYGIYIIRDMWPDHIINHIDELVCKINQTPKDCKLKPLTKELRLKYEIESQFRKLKSLKQLTASEIKAILIYYQQNLKALGHYFNTDSITVSEHVDYDLDQNYSYADVSENVIYPNYCNMGNDLTTLMLQDTNSEIDKRVQDVFTPDLQTFNNHRTNDIYQNLSTSSVCSARYNRINEFIAEDEDNINKLIPEVCIVESNNYCNNYTSKSEESNLTDRRNATDSTPWIKDQSKFHTPNQFSTTCSFSTEQNYIQYTTKDNTTIRLENINNISELDIQSLADDLEICSQVFRQERSSDDEGMQSYVTVDENKTSTPIQTERCHYVSPIVVVIEGPNDTSISFDEAGNTKCANKTVNDDNYQVENHPCDKSVNNEELYKSILSNCTNTLDSSARNESCVMSITNSSYLSIHSKEAQTIGNFQENTRSIVSPKPPRYLPENFKSSSHIDSSYESCIQNLEEEHAKDDSVKNNIELDKNSLETSADLNQSINVENKSKDGATNHNSSISVISKKSNSSVNKEGLHTSISDASKLRNLDQPNTSSTTVYEEDKSKKTSSLDTSISDASKKRKLDEATSNSSSKGNDIKTIEDTKTVDDTKTTDELDDSKKTVNNGSVKKTKVQRKFQPPRKKFIPPRKLSAKKIREEFEEQDRKLFECSWNSSNVSKCYEQLRNRPTVKQIQNTKHLALIRKTPEGCQVIPLETEKPLQPKKFNFTTRRSNETVDMRIFSDKNAKMFEQYLNSNEKDYKSVNFDFSNNNNMKPNDFNLQGIKYNEYVNNSTTTVLMRDNSESIENYSQQQAENVHNQIIQHNKLATTHQNLTPEGFYKQNKEGVETIVNKYLQGNYSQRDHYFQNNIKNNIFEDNNFTMDSLSDFNN